MGAGFLGNVANQTISKGVGNYDMIEGITSSVAGAASFMTAGMLLPAASTGNQAVAKAAASLGKRALSAGATGFKIGASTGLAADVSVQTAKILGGEQKRFDPFSTGLSTLAGGAVGAGIAAGAEVLANSNATGIIKNTLSKLRGCKGNKTRDIYRAVGVEEYEDIMATGKFRGIEGKSLATKEFGNDFYETLQFANNSINEDKVAIIKTTIPEEIYLRLNHMNLDEVIFKSGTPVVEPEMLDVFNEHIINIEHIY